MAAEPFTPTPFARRLTRAAVAWRAAQDGVAHPMLPDWADGVYPPLRALARRVVAEDAVRLHSHAAALTSSQVFALNLFLPWRAAEAGGDRRSLGALLGELLLEPIEVDALAFEWVPPGALLGELDGERPRPDEAATAVDLVLWARDARGAPLALLVEVKLGEGGFTPCGGKVSRANRRRDLCASAEAFLSDPGACYLRRPWGKTRERRYQAIFEAAHGSVAAAFPGLSRAGACPFAGDLQQPMRNHALSLALVQQGLAARSWFLLCAHDDNPEVHAAWQAWQRALGGRAPAPLLSARALLAAGPPAWGAWMAGRYALEPR